MRGGTEGEGDAKTKILTSPLAFCEKHQNGSIRYQKPGMRVSTNVPVCSKAEITGLSGLNRFGHPGSVHSAP